MVTERPWIFCKDKKSDRKKSSDKGRSKHRSKKSRSRGQQSPYDEQLPTERKRNRKTENIFCDCCDGKLRAAVGVSCCSAHLCRRCAVKSLIRKKRCGSKSCRRSGNLDTISLKPLHRIRALCEGEPAGEGAASLPQDEESPKGKTGCPFASLLPTSPPSCPASLPSLQVKDRLEVRPAVAEKRRKSLSENKQDRSGGKQICFSDDEDDSFLSSFNQRLIETFLDNVCESGNWSLCLQLDRRTVSILVVILVELTNTVFVKSNTVFFNSTNMTTNIESAVPSTYNSVSMHLHYMSWS